nr:MAG TPA: putative YmpT-like [Caudoviricetes sp.]
MDDKDAYLTVFILMFGGILIALIISLIFGG